jgi:hypothetical protein
VEGIQLVPIHISLPEDASTLSEYAVPPTAGFEKAQEQMSQTIARFGHANLDILGATENNLKARSREKRDTEAHLRLRWQQKMKTLQGN